MIVFAVATQLYNHDFFLFVLAAPQNSPAVRNANKVSPTAQSILLEREHMNLTKDVVPSGVQLKPKYKSLTKAMILLEKVQIHHSHRHPGISGRLLHHSWNKRSFLWEV